MSYVRTIDDRNVRPVCYLELLEAALEKTGDPEGYSKMLLSAMVDSMPSTPRRHRVAIPLPPSPLCYS